MDIPKLKLNLSADDIYNREFTGDKPGYDCTQVDTLLDAVIKDYEAVDEYCLQAQKTIASLNRTQRVLEEKNNELEAENVNLEKRIQDLEAISRLDPNAPRDQLSLLKRIASLEQALKDEGVDPSKVV